MSTARYPAGTSAVYTATLRNADGTAIVYDATNTLTPRISTLTLQLIDEISQTDVNSRTGNNHLNTNNVTVNTSGVLTWNLQPADTTVINTSLVDEPSVEEHRAVFVATYVDTDSNTKTLIHEHIVAVRNYVPLCRFEDVQLQIPGVENVDRQFIENLIDSVSLRCETYCDRKFLKATRTEYFNIDRNQTHIRVSRYPITSVANVWEDYTGQYSGDLNNTRADEYDALSRANKGIISCRYRPWTKGFSSVKVTYTGGLAVNVGGLPSDLRQSVARQVSYLYQKRSSLGVTGESIAGSSITLTSPDLLPDVKEVWASYKKKNLP